MRDGWRGEREKINLSQWPGPVLQLYLGKLTASQVFAAAADPDAKKQRNQQCEADFYTAEDALLHGHRALALEGLNAAVDGCPKSFFEYDGAGAELKRLGQPAAAGK